MPVETPPSMTGVGYDVAEVTKPPNWHGLVAWDLLLNNLTTGLYLVAAVGELAMPSFFRPLAPYAYSLALAFLTADLACLVLDLGDPLRFHHMLRVVKPSSPMSLGTWCLTAYSLPLTLIAAMEVARALGLLTIGPALGWVRTIALVLGLLPCLGSAVYKGVLFSTTSQPGWKEARWFGAYLVNSAVMLGVAQLLIIAAVTGQGGATAVLPSALAVLVVLNTIPLGLVFLELRPALARVGARGGLAHHNAWPLMIAGGVVPLIVLIAGRGTVAWLVAVASLLVQAYLIRHAIVMLPHRIHDTEDDRYRVAPEPHSGGR